ncbi:MAG: hypothetical protein AAFQ89_19820 [Cyanobacteria bacterium J06626_18]
MTNPAPDQSASNQPAVDHPAPEKVYENLKQLEQVDVAKGASYRQDAIAVLADTDVSMDMRDAIADRLGEANHLMTLKNVDPEESY